MAAARPGSSQYAARALRAYQAMQRRFADRDGVYRQRGRWHWPGAAEHLWPATRALVATLDLAGAGPTADFDADAAIAQQLATLARYWEPPAYSSDPIGARFGGDRYYDDNAWVGLALIQLERMRPGTALGPGLARAAGLFAFAAQGWDTRGDVPSPGGVFWVQQGRGVGARNHDRNTVSNAPNAQLGLHLTECSGGPPDAVQPTEAERMIAWVEAALNAGQGDAAPGTGLFWDKIRGDGSIDKTLWSYNQGSMVGANLLRHRRGLGASGEYLDRAQTIATRALRHYEGRYLDQPPAFNAIFFRNLLQLHAATDDDDLRDQIIAAAVDYADRLWSERRDDHDRFPFRGKTTTLLDQSAAVQQFALLAWDPADYAKLA
ncbi:MAG: glycoside hydrolase family 76 protein [Solirubrobacteraceae bacterium]